MHQLFLNHTQGNSSFLQVISYIILEEAEYKLKDAISSKEKVMSCYNRTITMQYNFTCIGNN